MQDDVVVYVFYNLNKATLLLLGGDASEPHYVRKIDPMIHEATVLLLGQIPTVS